MENYAGRKGFLSNDRLFLNRAAGMLILIGLTGTFVGLICYGLNLDYTRYNLIPIFGGLDVFQSDLALVNFSLAFLILGIGIKLFNAFGYFTSIGLLGVMMIAFGWLARILYGQIDMYLAHAASGAFDPGEYPLLESVILDATIAIWTLISMIYLLSKPVRKLYLQGQSDRS